MSASVAIPVPITQTTSDSASLLSTSRTVPSKISISESELVSINARLADAAPQEILEWAIDNLPGLYQTTAFGLTGTAAVDMISKISQQRGQKHLVPLIFLDTLYHFQETLDLAKRMAEKYDAPLHVYAPFGVSNAAQFEEMYGPELWKTDEDTYDYVVKVEPSRRSYDELNVLAVLTGRRKSQGADRASIKAVEVDETGLVKVNPLANWTFKDVKDYIDANGVPYNALLDKGYKSIGDWHSTAVPGSSNGDESERSGRWANKAKTECGLHKDYFVMKRNFDKKRREAELAARDAAQDKPVEPAPSA